MAHLVAAHLSTPPPRPSITQPTVPAAVDEVIATGMAKDPDQRYATTVELVNAGRRALASRDQVQGDTIAASTSSSGPLHTQPGTQLAATHRPPNEPKPDIENNTADKPAHGIRVVSRPNASMLGASSIRSIAGADADGLPGSGEGENRVVHNMESPHAPTKALWAGIAVGMALIAIGVIMVLALVDINPQP